MSWFCISSVHEKNVNCELCGKLVHNAKFSLHVNDCERWPKSKKRKIECLVMLTRLEDNGLLDKYGFGSSNAKFQCHGCSNQYESKMSMQRHYKIVHLNEKFQCDKCQKSFTDPRYLRDHQRSKHLGIFYQCQHCGKQFNIEVSFKSHVKKCTLK